MAGNGRTVFAFWEPRGSIPDYLRLCMKTWERNITGYRIVLLDHSNLCRYLDLNVLGLHRLGDLWPVNQKDILMSFVLYEHGGIFMDVDTLVFRDLHPILQELERTEVVTFGLHTGFMAARPRARIFRPWMARVRERLSRMEGDKATWDYFGTGVLEELLDEIIDRSRHPLSIPTGLGMRAFRAVTGPMKPREDPRLKRIRSGIMSRRRRLTPRPLLREYFAMLDREEWGFICEAAHIRSRWMGSREKYLRFWFQGEGNLKAVLSSDPVVVGLHNSWTPEPFSRLDAAGVMGAEGLLPDLLRHLLPDRIDWSTAFRENARS